MITVPTTKGTTETIGIVKAKEIPKNSTIQSKVNSEKINERVKPLLENRPLNITTAEKKFVNIAMVIKIKSLVPKRSKRKNESDGLKETVYW